MSSSLAIRRSRHLSTTVATAVSSTHVDSVSASKAKYDPDKALKIYSSISPNDTSPISSRYRYTQDYTVRRLAKSHRFSDIESLLESHKSHPDITQEPFLCSLIRSYGVAGMFEHALKTYNQMDELGTPRTVASFNALLSAGVVSKNCSRVPQMFDEIPERYGVVPNEVSYGILVKAYCEIGSTEVAVERLKEMEEKGVEITAITYTSIIHSWYKKGQKEEAEKVWSEMVKRGCPPDVGAYNVKISLVQREKSDKVEGLIEEMKNAGLKPDTITYNYLMTCYCMNEMMDKAEMVYKELEANGCKPNATTFRTLVFYLCKNQRFETAYEVFKQSVEVNKIPSFSVLKYLVAGLTKSSKKYLAVGIIRTVKAKFPPNVLKAWGKLEIDLDLVSDSNDADQKSQTSSVLE